jgi:hypothetical protein
MCGLSRRESVQIGFGMACRGEVALIVANKGMAADMLPPAFFGPIIIMVVVMAVVTPVLLKFAFRSEGAYVGLQESALAERFEIPAQLEAIEQNLVEADRSERKKR